MAFVKPMTCNTAPDDFEPGRDTWVYEEKFDGHRLIVEINNGAIHAWSRYGRVRALPLHVMDSLAKFSNGVLDGELYVPGGRSYAVTELTKTSLLVYVMFDILEVKGQVTSHLLYDQRRELLEKSFHVGPGVELAKSTPFDKSSELKLALNAVWERDGEGLILKRRGSSYQPGKRSKDFLKLKQLQSRVFEVIGFEAGTSEIQNRGPYAKVRLRDVDDNEISVKTLNDAELAKFEKDGAGMWEHPAIGRMLRVEFQERTPDGSYRHPRWDRWEDE